MHWSRRCDIVTTSQESVFSLSVPAGTHHPIHKWPPERRWHLQETRGHICSTRSGAMGTRADRSLLREEDEQPYSAGVLVIWRARAGVHRETYCWITWSKMKMTKWKMALRIYNDGQVYTEQCTLGVIMRIECCPSFKLIENQVFSSGGLFYFRLLGTTRSGVWCNFLRFRYKEDWVVPYNFISN